MRKLKFRADDGMGWIYSSAVEYREEDDQWLIFDFEQEEWMYCGEPEQYTGLKDKNDREIFESDILETVYQYNDKRQVRRMKVEVDTVNPCMVLVNVRNKNDVEYDFVQCGLMSHTILGNIHENPELLGDS